MLLSIIIVNFRTAGLLQDCIGSILEHTRKINFEIIVVDNNSGDNSEIITRSVFPQVQWIQMEYNAGFARANNAGMQIAKGEAVLLLNPDTIIKDNAIENAFQDLMSGDFIACGVQLLNADGSLQISGNYAMRGGLNYLLPLPYTGWMIKKAGELFGIKKPHASGTATVTEVDWINGAFLMVKKSAIAKAGLMDEDFFLYAEEAEWCSRLRKAGKLCIFGQYQIIHLQGVSANDAFYSSGKGYYNLYDKKGFQIMLSNFVRIRKEFGVMWFLFDLFAYTATVPVAFVFSIFHSVVFVQNPLIRLKKISGLGKNVLGLWGYAGKIISGRPYFYKVL